MTREPVVRGKFYPAAKESLQGMIGGFLAKNPARTIAKGAIVPHAGYQYSGNVAVNTLAKVMPPKKVIILGPNHSGLGARFGVFPGGRWKTPLGEVSVDEELAGKLTKKSSLLVSDETAHQFEHSIEVIVPLLQYFFKEFTFVPICCQGASLGTYRDLAGQMADVIQREKDTLIIASSDMTHYEPEAVARQKDRAAIESIVRLDEEELLSKAKKQNITMCGIATVPIMIACAKRLGAHKAEVVLYQTSADASGDSASVVGYLGAIVS